MDKDRYRMCFGCGPDNPHGLRLDIRGQADGSWRAEFVPEDYHCGWPGVVHGGVLAAVLDEVMSYIIFGKGQIAVTARMAVLFKRPAVSGEHLVVRASPTRETRRIVDARGEIVRDDGTLVATSEARFLILADEQMKSLSRHPG